DDHVVGVAGTAAAGGGRTGRRYRRVDLRDGVERGQNALADGGAERGSETADRIEQLLRVRAGRDQDDGGSREGNQADARATGLGLDEGAGRSFGGGDPVRLDVGGAHGAQTSRASMIVADDDATGTVACGRAAPTASTARPSVSSATGMRRRQRERPGMAVRTSASEVTRTTERLRLRRVSHQAAKTSGMTRSASSAHGQEKDIQTTRPVRVTVSTAPAASSTRARAMNAPASG